MKNYEKFFDLSYLSEIFSHNDINGYSIKPKKVFVRKVVLSSLLNVFWPVTEILNVTENVAMITKTVEMVKE